MGLPGRLSYPISANHARIEQMFRIMNGAPRPPEPLIMGTTADGSNYGNPRPVSYPEVDTPIAHKNFGRSPRTMELAEVKTKLEPWLQTMMPGAKDVTISNLQKPSMGLSSETHFFDVNWEETGKPKSMEVVLRSAPRSRGIFPEYDMGLQFRIMKIHGKNTNVPV